MFLIFRDVRRRMSLTRVAIIFIFAMFVFAAPVSAGEVFGVPADPTPPSGPDDFSDAEFEPTVAPGPGDFTDAEFEPTVVPGLDDFTNADPEGGDPDDEFEPPFDAGEPFAGADDGAVPVGLVAALPSTGSAPSDRANHGGLAPLFALAAAGSLLATGLLRSGGNGGSHWGRR